MGHTLDVLEKHRRAAIKMFLQAGDLKIGIDFLIGLDKIAIGAQP